MRPRYDTTVPAPRLYRLLAPSESVAVVYEPSLCSVGVPPPLHGLNAHEPAPIPESAAPPGGPAAVAGRRARRGRGGVPCRVREPVRVQPRVPADVWRPPRQDVAALK